MNHKLLLVNKGLGSAKIEYFSSHFKSPIIVDVPEPAEDEAGGVAILAAAIKEQYVNKRKKRKYKEKKKTKIKINKIA